MRKNLIYLSMLFSVLIVACKKENIAVYNDESSKNSIYFPLADTTSNIFVSFGYANATVKDSIVKIVVRAIGAAAKQDRPYELAIIDSTTTMLPGTNYEILNKPLSIKAGKVADTLKIKLNRTLVMRDHALRLYFDLIPNEHFTTTYFSKKENNGDVKYFTRLNIKADDIAGAPEFWLAGSSYYSYTFGYLGTFSTLKFQLLLSRYNLNVNELIKPGWFLLNGNYRRISGWALGLKAYLNQMAAVGTPVYEVDGVTLMKMGANVN
jgi:hypothetical protein